MEAWFVDAACQGNSTAIFFPELGLGRPQRREARAKRICARCSVRKQCLTYALDNNIEDGIFGGLTYEERIQYVVAVSLDSV